MRYTTRPLSDRTWLRPASARKPSRFDSTWTATKELLAREIDHLGGRDVVIEVDVREQDIRNDGMLRSNARTPEQPGVVVAFETKAHGPMLYRCDRFYAPFYGQVDWQQNVRAIALTLEALRAVDRYGATETGQQYAGFKALPAGTAMGAPSSSHLTATDAQARVIALAGVHAWPTSDSEISRVVQLAKRAAHPDRNAGDHTEWRELAEALLVLRLT